MNLAKSSGTDQGLTCINLNLNLHKLAHAQQNVGLNYLPPNFNSSTVEFENEYVIASHAYDGLVYLFMLWSTLIRVNKRGPEVTEGWIANSSSCPA